jgi:hypothetical protein
LDKRAERMLRQAGWRDPQQYVTAQRAPTTGYWYANEPLPLRLDQARLTGTRIEVLESRTLVSDELDALSDHRPVILVVRLHTHPVNQRPVRLSDRIALRARTARDAFATSRLAVNPGAAPDANGGSGSCTPVPNNRMSRHSRRAEDPAADLRDLLGGH